MAKEKNHNPVQAHHKAEKAKVIRKGKAEVQSRRNEKLARRNPDRIRRQIDDLKAITSSGGSLTKHEEQTLAGLESELRSVHKAREALGDRAPTFGSGKGAGVLGKRRRDGHDDDSTGDEDIPDDVRNIPMPRDTPPPIPKDIMDAWWAKRRARQNAGRELSNNKEQRPHAGSRVDDEDGDGGASKQARGPAPEGKTVYSSQPVLRDLRKEAVAFVPAAVRTKMTGAVGTGGTAANEQPNNDGTASQEQSIVSRPRQVEIEDVDEENM